MKVNELSIIELKTYFDIINNKIKDTDIDIKINGETKNKLNFRSKLYVLKTLFEEEICNRISNINFE